jgi:hypothetical protein
MAARPSGEESMDITRSALKAEKKNFILTNMELTKDEEKAFLPVYDSYERTLSRIYERYATVVGTYVANYATLSDDKATDLMDQTNVLDEELASLNKKFVLEFTKILPPKKVVRFFQLENKIRSVVRYDLATTIPLVE